jgi:hypothetical protein
MEQHALAAFEIADYLYVPEFGKLNMLGDAPKLLDESFVTAANLEGHLVKAIVYDVVGAPALVCDVAEPDCPEDGAVITGVWRSAPVGGACPTRSHPCAVGRPYSAAAGGRLHG